MVIGSLQIEFGNIQYRGIRISADVTVKHMWSNTEGNTHTYPIIITTELLESWGYEPEQATEAIQVLLRELYDIEVGGLAVSGEPPKNGYWFDTNNSASTLNNTKGIFINAQDHLPFLANPADKHRISGIFGGAVLTDLEHADAAIHQKTGKRLLGDMDSAFDRSLAVVELSTPPADEKDLGHKINLLGTIVDKFKGTNPENKKDVKSIRALENWLGEKVGSTAANNIVAPFDGIRGLRNQYPTHDQFGKGRTELKHVKAAEAYFGFRDIDDPTTKWKKICDAFRAGIIEVAKVLG